MTRTGRATCTTLAVMTLLIAAGCADASRPDGSSYDSTGSSSPSDRPATPSRPAVEVAPDNGPLSLLDPEANPSTQLGWLRAQYLPVWTPDFDWAFPPEVCDTAWELDGIAQRTVNSDLLVLDGFATAAALSVMRFEHQTSRALAEPNPLAQLCVATVSVEPARSETLSVLESYLETGARRSEPAAYPQQVWVVAVSPASAVAVACVRPGYPAVVGSGGQTIEPVQSPARLQAYLLTASLGVEDRVVDISYRVSNTTDKPAGDCDDLDTWAREWNGRVETWIGEGQIWEPLAAIVTAEAICESSRPESPHECPGNWRQ